MLEFLNQIKPDYSCLWLSHGNAAQNRLVSVSVSVSVLVSTKNNPDLF